MILFINILTAALCFVLSYICLDADGVDCCKLLRSRNEANESEEKYLSTRQVVVISLILTACTAVTLWRLNVYSWEMLNTVKLSLALLCLVGGACVDYIEHRIPNIFPAVTALGAIFLLALGFVVGQDGAMAYVVSSVFAAAVTTLCLIAASLLSHQGIGMGDIKMLGSLALMGGVYMVGGTLFYAMITCSVTSAVLLITKKKTIRQAVPFGPFVLLGYMIAICTMQF